MADMAVHFSSATDLWATPKDFYDKLDAEFHFTLDPCATDGNHKCDKYFTIDDDGLAQDWSGERVFMNPPYGREIGKWVKKAKDSNALVVCLVPARTDTRWWHDNVIDGGGRSAFHQRSVKVWGSRQLSAVSECCRDI